MHISGIVQIVFSPTGGTQKVADMITDAWNLPIRRIDISQLVLSDMRTAADELCVIAVPSFGGRVPEIACRRIRQLSAQGSPAVLVAVYGNRAFEDTLVELEDTVKEAGFVPIAGIAAVAEHSIMHQYGAGRPDDTDRQVLRGFAGGIWDYLLQMNKILPVSLLPGSRPYKEPMRGGIQPFVTGQCTGCGLCAVKCPTGAIQQDAVRITDRDLCISCMRCVSICPHQARKINPVVVYALAYRLKDGCAGRKEDELFM